jgi:hypothetical protein
MFMKQEIQRNMLQTGEYSCTVRVYNTITCAERSFTTKTQGDILPTSMCIKDLVSALSYEVFEDSRLIVEYAPNPEALLELFGTPQDLLWELQYGENANSRAFKRAEVRAQKGKKLYEDAKRFGQKIEESARTIRKMR